MRNRYSSSPRIAPKSSYTGRLDDKGNVMVVAPYVLQDIPMSALLDGSVPVPGVSADVTFNGIDTNDVTYYARDVFEGLEAMKSSLGIVNNTIDAERSISSDKE